MFKTLATLAALTAAPLQAACTGEGLLESLTDDERARVEAAAAGTPYGEGLFWEARRGADVMILIGTLHLDDPRFAALMPRVEAALDGAELVLLEMTPVEEAQLETAIATDADLLLLPGTATLPALMDPEVWEALASEARDRGLPPFMVSRMQPWYLSLLLSVPACAFAELMDGSRGLDRRITEMAEARGIPMQALEPFDTLFRIFADEPLERQVELISLGLLPPDVQRAAFVSTLDGYFDEEMALVWELGRAAVRMHPKLTQAEADALFADLEADLLIGRNLNWVEVIAEAMESHDRVVVAAGGAHLPGETGVLNLLARDGWAIRPLP